MMSKTLLTILAVIVILGGIVWIVKDRSINSLSPTYPQTTNQATTTSPTLTNPPTTAVSADASAHFGIAAGGGLSSMNQTDLMARLTAIKKLGVGWVRFDIDWSVIQQAGPNNYNWAPYDRIVADLNTLGLKGLGIIVYTPAWAAPSSCPKGENKCAPSDPSVFANFAQTVVARYKSEGLQTYEIWNEPNLKDFWKPAPNVDAYTDLLKESYTAIKQIDPSAFILSAGLSRATTGDGDISPIDFLTGLYQDGAKNYFDAVAFHPYTFPAPPNDFQTWNAWSQIASTTPSMRSVMVQNGDSNKQIWITEFGAPTGGVGAADTESNYASNPYIDHVTEAFQAEIISEAITSIDHMSWAGPIFIYTYTDINGSTSYNENFFGLVRFDGSLKPAYTTYKNLISQYK